MIVLHIIFWLSILLIAHSYMIFPWLLQLLSTGKKENDICFTDSELPDVTIIMAVFNEEHILPQKLDSILTSDYPSGKISVLVGSDASTDGTNRILGAYSEKHPEIRPYYSGERKGKPAMINYLSEQAEDEMLLFTDAKVIFDRDTIRGLVRHFKNEHIGIVGCNIINRTIRRDGVSIQESAFMSREILMKYREGLVWGSTVGVYGAAYAIRKAIYTPVPEGFSVDDFFITLSALRKKKIAMLDINVVAYLEVPNLITEEYRRKVRIATGNFQNLAYFGRELLTPWKGSSFAYFSHKVIRWIAPFLLIAILLSNIFLLDQHPVYEITLGAMAVFATLPIIDLFLSKIGIHIVFLRFVRHFVTMNIALLHGFINNTRGVKKHVWQPTER